MSKQTKALKLALAAERVLQAWDDPQGMPALCEEMNCLREALAEQPPCKYPHCPYPCPDLLDCRDAEQPAQRKPLTEEEISRLNLTAVTVKDAISDVREVEAAHGIKGDA